MGTSFGARVVCSNCYPCPPTKLLPMSPDRTQRRLTSRLVSDAYATALLRRASFSAPQPGRYAAGGIMLRLLGVILVAIVGLHTADAQTNPITFDGEAFTKKFVGKTPWGR